MIVAVHQPNYLPYLGFFHKMLLSDVFILYDTAQFSKNDFHNRNRIKTPKGPMWLTVPVRRPAGRAIRDVEADSSKPWAKEHWSAIRANYARAKHFAPHAGALEHLYEEPRATLAEIGSSSIRFLAESMGIRKRVVWASELKLPPDLSPSGKLARLVRLVGGDTYLSGPGGTAYLEREDFGDMEVLIQEFRHPVYDQLWGEFAPNVSALDAVLNLATDAGTLLESCGTTAPFPWSSSGEESPP